MKPLLLTAAFIGCVFVTIGTTQTLDPSFAETWPGSVAALPSTPRACWLTGDDCYPEIRNFIEAQWHDSLTDAHSLDDSRHLHIGCAFPYETRGVLRLDCRVMAFHWEGGVFESVRDVKINSCPGCPRLLPSPSSSKHPGIYNKPITQHLQQFYVPIYIDTTSAPYDGPTTVQVTAGFRFIDDEGFTRTANASLQVGLYLKNGNPCSRIPCPTPSAYGTMSATGWINTTRNPDGTKVTSPFGYLRIRAGNVRRFDSVETKPLSLYLTARPFRLNTVLIAQNPDLHTHPPDYGSVLLDQTPLMTVAYKGDVATQGSTRVSLQQPFQVPGDRLMIRFADFTPDPHSQITTAGASLLVVTLGKAR